MCNHIAIQPNTKKHSVQHSTPKDCYRQSGYWCHLQDVQSQLCDSQGTLDMRTQKQDLSPSTHQTAQSSVGLLPSPRKAHALSDAGSQMANTQDSHVSKIHTRITPNKATSMWIQHQRGCFTARLKLLASTEHCSLPTLQMPRTPQCSLCHQYDCGAHHAARKQAHGPAATAGACRCAHKTRAVSPVPAEPPSLLGTHHWGCQNCEEH